MTTCTQLRCTGTIVDGYCDVCGSPVGAVAFVPAEAAASAGSPAHAGEPGRTAAGPGSGFPPKPKNAGETACTQPGCTGMIVDCYCDVCGSPADAAPLVPAKTAASALDEEIPIQRIRRPTQQLSTQETAGPVAADPVANDPAAGAAEKVDWDKELAENETDGAQDYRARVEEAQLPADVREAALREVDKLERTSDQNPQSDDIRNWLDTMLDLPWSTKIMDSIDIQGSREVEATLQRLIEPAVADVEEGDTAEADPAAADVEVGDTAEADPAAADVEEGDTAEAEPVVADLEEDDTAEAEEEGDPAEAEPVVADVEEDDTAEADPADAHSENVDRASAGPHDDDTVETPAVLAGLSGDGNPRPQLPERQVVGSVLVETPTEKRRFRSLALAAALAVLLIGALLFAAGRDRGVTAQSAPTVTATAIATVNKPTSEPSDESTGTKGEESTIQLEDLPASARPFEAVHIQGTYRGGSGTFLRVQRWEGGKWLDFPIPTMTDHSGRFITQAEFGQPGGYRLRVVDPDSGVTSKPFVVVIKG